MPRTGIPLCGMPAASSCSCSRRSYGWAVPYRSAIRPRRTPSRIQSVTWRMAVRTSSSGSLTLTIAEATGRSTPVLSTVTPTRARASNTCRSAPSSPVTATLTMTAWCWVSVRSSSAPAGERSCSRCTTTGPTVAPSDTTAVAARTRSCSSYQADASSARTCWATLTTSAARALHAATASNDGSVSAASSRVEATRASSVAGCSATGANTPGSTARTARTAWASTRVDTGLRPAAASDAAPSRSASRDSVRKVTFATPPGRPASARRVDTAA